MTFLGDLVNQSSLAHFQWKRLPPYGFGVLVCVCVCVSMCVCVCARARAHATGDFSLVKLFLLGTAL